MLKIDMRSTFNVVSCQAILDVAFQDILVAYGCSIITLPCHVGKNVKLFLQVLNHSEFEEELVSFILSVRNY